jgi:5-hydroxyisourate hydrolase
MVTTHILDTSRGRPATGVHVVLEQRRPDGGWTRVGEGHTDDDGRLRTLTAEGAQVAPGLYRLTFGTGQYFEARQVRAFYPTISVTFEVLDNGGYYHVPLLLSPFGYCTYRGS